MSILGIAKKIGKHAIKALPGGDIAVDVLDALGDMGQGRAAGRQAAAATNHDRDILAQQAYANRQGSILRAAEASAQQNRADAELGLAAPSMRAKQAVLGDALKNYAYKAPTHARANVVDFGSPFTLSDDTRALGGLLSSGALADQRAGNSPLDKVDFMRSLIDAPQMTPLPKSGWLDKVLELSGFAGDVGEAVRGQREPSVARELSVADITPVRPGVPNVGTPANISTPDQYHYLRAPRLKRFGNG